MEEVEAEERERGISTTGFTTLSWATFIKIMERAFGGSTTLELGLILKVMMKFERVVEVGFLYKFVDPKIFKKVRLRVLFDAADVWYEVVLGGWKDGRGQRSGDGARLIPSLRTCHLRAIRNPGVSRRTGTAPGGGPAPAGIVGRPDLTTSRGRDLRPAPGPGPGAGALCEAAGRPRVRGGGRKP
ncbi:hypothetical protein NDU88_011337 [Pleurodeles waltl]|uniref:Uncharacterized protein n=1 Tax=Pleurodeles waltl TaxID=8319 RepID=A0AAV7R0P5_PLEWA|nr:hypothetical protein NDU88_011337 [Pleurodeles waltl]